MFSVTTTRHTALSRPARNVQDSVDKSSQGIALAFGAGSLLKFCRRCSSRRELRRSALHSNCEHIDLGFHFGAGCQTSAAASQHFSPRAPLGTSRAAFQVLIAHAVSGSKRSRTVSASFGKPIDSAGVVPIVVGRGPSGRRAIFRRASKESLARLR